MNMQPEHHPPNNNNTRSVAHSNISASINPYREAGKPQRNKSVANKISLKGIQR